MSEISFGYRQLGEVAKPFRSDHAATMGWVQSVLGGLVDGAVTPAKLVGVPALQAGHLLGYDGAVFYDDGVPGDPFMRSGAVASSIPRTQITVATLAAVGTGILDVVAVRLRKGMTFSKITWLTGTTAMAAGTHQWYSLYSPLLGLLGVTNDDTSNAWPANSEKSLTITGGPLVALQSGVFYIGKTTVATTVPTTAGVNGFSTFNGFAPLISGSDNTHTGLVDPSTAPNPATVAAHAPTPYAYVGN